jgi:hypothetical protein
VLGSAAMDTQRFHFRRRLVSVILDPAVDRFVALATR